MIIIYIFIYVLIAGIVCYIIHNTNDIEDDILLDIMFCMLWPVILISIHFIGVGYLGYILAEWIYNFLNKKEK